MSGFAPRPLGKGAMFLSVGEQKGTERVACAAQGERLGLRQVLCSPRIFLRRPAQELPAPTVRRSAAFDLVQPSYVLAALAVEY